MTPKTKVAPKAKETVAPVEVAAEEVKPIQASKAKRTIKRKETILQHAEYEIPKNAGIVYMLPQKGITVYDSEKDTVREMRYCPNEPSIWADEQGDNARKETVAFREGKLFVAKDKPNLRLFMDNHPMNMANGGKIFRQVDKKKDAETAPAPAEEAATPAAPNLTAIGVAIGEQDGMLFRSEKTNAKS